MRLSTFNGQISAQTLILSGVIVGAILSAVISFLKYLADEQVAVIIFWLMGDLSSAGPESYLLLLAVLPCFVVIAFLAQPLNLLLTGRESASALGVNVVLVSCVLLLVSSLMVSLRTCAGSGKSNAAAA